MRYLGLDLGTKTLGISISESGIIANPYQTIRYDNIDQLLTELVQIIETKRIDKVILGMPKNMNNTMGPSAIRTQEFKELLASKSNVDIIFEDERMTSMQANNIMLEADLRREKRKEKADTLAAVLILQSYLDRKRD